jgi:hypothetical protein
MFQYVDWIQLSQDWFQWLTFANPLINFSSVFLKKLIFRNFNEDTATFGY